MMNLNALADDWKLRADADTPRDSGLSMSFSYYLTDASGNYLTDASGNRLIAMQYATVYPQKLNAIADDWKLIAE